MRIQLGDYVLEVDSERTKSTYIEIEKGGAETCKCVGCKNYVAALPGSLPDEVLQFFYSTGIDPKKNAEVYEQGEILPGIHSYGGEYYLWGSIVSEPKREHVLSKGFRFAFMKPSPLAQKQFRNEGALCFYFNAEIPWVLARDASA